MFSVRKSLRGRDLVRGKQERRRSTECVKYGGGSLERMELIFPVLQALHLVSVAAAEVAAETEVNTKNQGEQAAGGAQVCWFLKVTPG